MGCNTEASFIHLMQSLELTTKIIIIVATAATAKHSCGVEATVKQVTGAAVVVLKISLFCHYGFSLHCFRKQNSDWIPNLPVNLHIRTLDSGSLCT